MSLVKSQIHDGFATIRTRGLHRSRSRAEQFEKIKKPSVIKSESVPLYENNNDLFYGGNALATTTCGTKVGTPTPSLSIPLNGAGNDQQNIGDIDEYDGYCRSPSSTTFKSSDSYHNGYGSLQSFDSGTPKRSPSSSIGQVPKTPDSLTSSQQQFFPAYIRPDSPQYGRISRQSSSHSNDEYKCPAHCCRSTESIDMQPLMQQHQQQPRITAKPPIKAQTLQYRKSYSHPARTIYEETSLSVGVGGGSGGFGKHHQAANHYYNPQTNYFSPGEISQKDTSSTDQLIESSGKVMVSRVVPHERLYATIGHLGKEKRFQPIGASNSEDLSAEFRYVDPLDCKIGCQTTLRSKPVIPWYELAIKRENRRQSCPAFEAHVVAAFEQSLSNMTQRLQQLTATAERKDGELTDMRQTIELLRKQSIQAGLTSAHMQSMGVQQSTAQPAPEVPPPSAATAATMSAGQMQRHHSSDSMCSLNSLSSGCSAQDKKKKKGWLRSSFTKAFSRNAKISKTNRHVSTASNLDHTPPSISSNDAALPPPSPTKSPHRMVTVIENSKPVDAVDSDGNLLVEDLKKQLREKDLVLTDIRLEALSSASQLESLKDTVMKMRAEMMNLKQNNERLQKMVTSRSLAGSEVSLGGPVSPNGSLGDTRRYSLADGNTRPPMELPKSLEETEEENIPPAPAPEPPPPPLSPMSHSQLTPPPPAIEAPNSESLSTPAEDVADHTDGKKISIVVYLGQPEAFPKYAEDLCETDNYYSSNDSDEAQENGFDNKHKHFTHASLNEFVIAYTYISGKTTWQNLDYIVRKTFKDYLSRIDPGTNLGLNTDSITSYHLGDAKRGPEMGFPELLPCGYIVGHVKSLYICLQGVGSLAFDSLIPRSIVHRYISLLTEHRRLILCGPSGTGKSYLARKLAEFLVSRIGRGNPAEAIATFNVDHKSSKELRQYLGHIAEQASMTNGASELPSVIILDNLHHASALGDVFQVLLSAGSAAKLPCIIGTMSQATCNTTNLQLHHNFRWVLTANHMEPVKGFLGRFLRRRLFSLELQTQVVQPQLATVFAWLPTVWQHINRFLETHSSSDVTIGPRLFLSCPLELSGSQVWFTDVWNYHLAPYLIEAVREGVQLYGRRGGAWVDPYAFIKDSYPWQAVQALRQITAEDVGLENGTPGNGDCQDPLLNMLMRLQEAANYSGNQEQESDCASLDSNITQDDSSVGAE